MWGHITAYGGLETGVAGMSVAWATAAFALGALTLLLRREIKRRQARGAKAVSTPTYPAPAPKVVLRLPRRDARN